MRNFVQLSLLVLVLSTAVHAQSNYASLSGTVSDPQQKVLAHCDVQLVSSSTGASHQAITNEEGVFQITGLLPGDYNLTVQSPGFATINQKLTLEVGQSMNLDLSLKVASVSSVVDVNADTINVLKTTDASVGEVVEPTAVANLPLGICYDRDYQAASSCRGIQRTQSHEPRNSKPLRQHTTVRHDHRSCNAGP